MHTYKANAKINLSLDVLKKREDGFHEVEMIMTTIDLADRLIFSEIDSNDIVIKTDKFYLPVDESNIVYKTIELIKTEYQINKGIEVFIEKNIPIAAGLAGGSANAAVTIKALNKIWELDMSEEKMMELGARLGSDVPFCIYNKTALATGRGEIITPISQPPKCWVLIVKPHFGVSTKEIYESIKMDEIEHPDTKAMLKFIEEKNYKGVCNTLKNSLEKVTSSKYPIVNDVKNKLQKYGVDGVLMSGSGPTVFALIKNERKAKRILNSIDKCKFDVFSVRLLG